MTEIDTYVARLLLIRNLTKKRDEFHHRSAVYALINDEINQLMEMCVEDMNTMYLDQK